MQMTLSQVLKLLQVKKLPGLPEDQDLGLILMKEVLAEQRAKKDMLFSCKEQLLLNNLT